MVYKTGLNPFSKTTLKIKEEWLHAAIVKWRHFLFAQGNYLKSGERKIYFQ